jgi:multiple sugar transport system substrate-binding protein
MGPFITKWEQQTARDYERAHPNVTINSIGVTWAQYNAKLLAMFAAGDIPEVFATFAAGFGTFLINEALADLKPYLARDKVTVTNVFEKSAIEALTHFGKLLGLPMGSFGTHLFYNATLFKKAGLKLPPSSWTDTSWTLDRMLESAQKMTHDINNPQKGEWGVVFSAQQLGVMSWLWGIDPFNEKGGPQYTKAYQTAKLTHVYYTNSKFVEAMQWIADLPLKYKAGPLPADINAIEQGLGDPFITGRVGLYLNGQWELQSLKTIGPKWQWGVAPLPWGPGKVNTTPLYNDSWLLGKKAKQPEAGFEFLKYLTMGPPATGYSEGTGFFPALLSLYDKAVASYAAIPGASQSKEEIKAVLTGAFSHGYVTPGKTLANYNEFNTAWGQGTSPIWNGQATAAAQLPKVQQKFQNIIHSLGW